MKTCLRHQFPPVFTDTGGPWLVMVVAVVLMRNEVGAQLPGGAPHRRELQQQATSAQQGQTLPRSLSGDCRHSSSCHLSWPSAAPFPHQQQAPESVPWWRPEQPSSPWVTLSRALS